MLSLLLLTTFSMGTGLAQTNGEVAPNVFRIGTIKHFGLQESSGLTSSRRYPGVIWSHNDGGYQFIFAMRQNGDHIGAFEVVGANLIDWEAISSDTNGFLYLADIGTNGLARSHVAVHRVPEPNPYERYGNAEVNRTWYLRFPGPRENCESFFVLNGFGYLVSKHRIADQVTMYRFALSNRADSVTLERVTSIPVGGAITDAAVSPDQQRLGLVSTEGVYFLFFGGNPFSAGAAPRQFIPLVTTNMEGGTFVTNGFLTSAETRELFLFGEPGPPCTDPPVFATFPQNQIVNLGGSAQFSASATGCGPFSIQWRFNEVLIPGQTNLVLNLANVTAAQAGRYEITISNPSGSIKASAALIVRPEPDVACTNAPVFTSVPQNQVVPAGGAAQFSANATGCPPFSIQWRFNDLVIPGQTNFTINLTNVTAGQAGRYEISVSNSNGVVRAAATLTVQPPPDPNQCTNAPAFTALPQDQTVLRGGTVEFSAMAAGCPPPVFQWLFNDLPIAGETGPTLQLTNIRTDQAGRYEVIASNSNGAVRAGATLTVRAKPVLRITEVMPLAATSPGVPTADWWELTNLESQSVDLSGWRFNDSIGGLSDPFVFGNGLVIGPGESIVFVENLSADLFRSWWGEANLPPGLQIVTYSGNGLSFRASGDTVILWDNVTQDPNDYVDRADFGAATAGVSFNYDPSTQQFGAPSELGRNGVIRAASASDIGSPGRITAPSPTPFLQIVKSPLASIIQTSSNTAQVRIEFNAKSGSEYSLQILNGLSPAKWVATGERILATNDGRVSFEKSVSNRNQFWRIKVD